MKNKEIMNGIRIFAGSVLTLFLIVSAGSALQTDSNKRSRLRGIAIESRSLRTREYYSGGTTGLQAFVLECKIQLDARRQDNSFSRDDFASFLYEYCSRSDFPGPACKTTKEFWDFYSQFQQLFAKEYCDVDPSDDDDGCLEISNLGTIENSGTIEKLCESTYRILEPSGIVSVKLRNGDFNDSFDEKKKKKKMKKKPELRNGSPAPTIAPSGASPQDRTFISSSPAPSSGSMDTLGEETAPPYIGNIFDTKVFGKDTAGAITSTKSLQLGFGVIIFLMFLGTAMIVVYMRRFPEGDEYDYFDNPPGGGVPTGTTPSSLPKLIQEKESNYSKVDSPESKKIGEKTSLLVKKLRKMVKPLKRPETADPSYNECSHNDQSEDQGNSETDECSRDLPNETDDSVVSTLMSDDIYLSEFEPVESKRNFESLQTPLQELPVSMHPETKQPAASNDKGNNSREIKCDESSIASDDRAGVGGVVEAKEERPRKSFTPKQECVSNTADESDELMIRLTMSNLKRRFEKSPKGDTVIQEDSREPAPRGVRVLRSQFLPIPAAAPSVVKDLRGQFEKKPKMTQKRMTENMTSHLAELRKQFER